MPVNDDSACLNEQLGEWFQKKCPDFLNRVTGEQFHEIIQKLIEIKDVYAACRLIERLANVRADEDLILVLLKDYNDYVFKELSGPRK